MRVTSWLPTKVCGTNVSRNSSCRSSAQASSKKLRVVERAPDRLPQLVLGDRVDRRLGDERGVVAVDDLADEPRVRVLGAHAGQDLRPERRRHRVGRVQPPAVGAAVQPVLHHARPRGRPRSGASWSSATSAPCPSKPANPPSVVAPASRNHASGGASSASTERLRKPESAADVVEHAVEQHPQAALVRLGDERVEVGVVAEPGVDAEVVDGVVAVRARRRTPARARARRRRARRRSRASATRRRRRCSSGRRVAGSAGYGADGAQRVDVPPDRVLGPSRARSSAPSSPSCPSSVGRAGGDRRARAP